MKFNPPIGKDITKATVTGGRNHAIRIRRSESAVSQLDQVNQRIITLMRRNARMSFKSLASEIGISPVAVLHRVQRLRALTLIRFTIHIDFKTLGLPYGFVIGIRAEDSQREMVIQQMAVLPNMLRVTRTRGRFNIVGTVYFESATPPPDFLSFLHRLNGVEARLLMPITRTGGLARSSGKTTKLSEIDYTIIRQMQDDSRLSANELSRDAKLPHYTVRRHLDRLLEENIITPLILAQPGLSGYSEGEAFLKVKQEHLNQVWDSLQRHPSLADYVSVIQGDYNIVASIWGKSDADLERLAEYDFGTLRGVQSCDLLIHESSETGRITGQSEGTKPARSIVTTPEIPSCLRIFGMPGSWLPPISIPRGQRNGKRGTSQMQLTARNQSRRRKLTG